MKPISIAALLVVLVAGRAGGASPDFAVAGGLRIDLDPPAAGAGAGWQLVEERDERGFWVVDNGAWTPAGAAIEGLAPGAYTVLCRPAAGFAEPPALRVVVPAGALVARTILVQALETFASAADIPSLNVRHGETLAFKVAGGASLVRFEAHPEVTRDIEFSSGVFSYRPHPAEREAFAAAFRDAGGEREVLIQPQPAAEAEHSVLSYVAPLPDPTSPSYLTVTDEPAAAAVNYGAAPGRQIVISGPTVVFERGHPTALVENFTYTPEFGVENVKSLTVYADTVIVRNVVELRQTDVTLFARELRFEDPPEGAPASLSTTPKRLDAAAGRSANGARGLNAGSITLNVAAVFAPGSAPRFILNGGDGQNPGPGADGAPLANPARQVFTNWTKPANAPNYPAGWSGRVIRVVQKEVCIVTITRAVNGASSANYSDADVCARSGNNASAAGSPGKGGSGGVLKAPFDLAALAGLDAGAAGARGRTYFGSPADAPLNALHVEGRFNCLGQWDPWILTRNCGNVNGADAASPAAAGVDPSPGAIDDSAGPFAWLHPIAIRSLLLYVKDAYLNGHYDAARALLEPYAAALEAMADEDKSLELFQVEEEVSTLLHRLESRLDYFGNPAGWVPLLSFEVTKQLYEDEVSVAGDILYLTNFLTERADEAIDRAAAIARLRAEIEREIEDFEDALAKNTARMDALAEAAARIQSDISRIGGDLEARRQDLESQAQLQAGLKKAFRVAGAVLPMIPVAQPALAVAGAAFTTASRFNEAPPLDLAAEFLESAIPAGIEDFLQDQAEEDETPGDPRRQKVATLQQGIQSVRAGIQGVVSVIREAQSWESDVDAELDLLVSQDPQSQGFVEDIRRLNAEKRRFAEDLAAATQDSMQLMDSIAQNHLAAESLRRDSVATAQRIDHEAFSYIKELDRRARDRLLYYQYLMAKSYEYRMVAADHEVNYQLGGLFDFYKRLSTPIAISSDPEQSVIGGARVDERDLIAVYTAELREITKKIVERILRSNQELHGTTFYTLSTPELAELKSKGEVRVNLRQSPVLDDGGAVVAFGVFDQRRENIRISSLTVREGGIEVSSPSGINLNDVVTVRIEHSNESIIESGGNTYRFTHRRTADRDARTTISWPIDYFPRRNILEIPQPAAAARSLIASLLEGEVDDVLIYSRPGAWADLRIINETRNRDISIDALTLAIEYDFFLKPGGVAEIEVRSSTESDEPLVAPMVVAAADRNSRRDGRGSFQRFYRNGELVSIAAPAAYGIYAFKEWVDVNSGRALSSERLLSLRLAEGVTQALAVYTLDGGPLPGSGYRRGDVNIDAQLDLSDSVRGLNYLFAGAVELPCLKALDANDDGLTNISDPVYLLNFLFTGGDAPGAPFGACGSDPTPDDLSCESYTACR
jgi:hypothetical protein